jgi:UDP-glucose 4-epimerase
MFTSISEILQKEKFDALMHFAGYMELEESVSIPKKYFDNNTKNSKILFDTCIKNNLKNIIFFSTAAAYGNPVNSEPIKESTDLKPINPYGESKIQSELHLKENSQCNFIILRYFNVAGADPKMRSGLISKKATHLIKIASEVAVGKRKDKKKFGFDFPSPVGSAVRGCLLVSDLAGVPVFAVEYLVCNQPSHFLICGFGSGFSVSDVFPLVVPVYVLPISIQNGVRKAGAPSMLVSTVSKLHSLFDWQPN